MDMNMSKVFSKLDIKMAFHQIDLNEESRGITTFTAHVGLFRYKSSSTEKYQQIMQQVLQGTGAVNIVDDVIMHGSSQEEHDEKLLAVLKK